MSTIIIYSTNYGATEKCARIITDKIGGDTQLVRLGTDEMPCIARRISLSAARFMSAGLKALLKGSLRRI